MTKSKRLISIVNWALWLFPKICCLECLLSTYTFYEGTLESVAHRKEGDALDLLFSIQVEEIAPIKQQLQTNNIPIENDYDIPVGEYLYIRDPNGYRICLYELFVP